MENLLVLPPPPFRPGELLGPDTALGGAGLGLVGHIIIPAIALVGDREPKFHATIKAVALKRIGPGS